MDHRQFGGLQDNKHEDLGLKGPSEEWGLSPSLLDSNPYGLNPFASHTTGYYPPTPGATGTFYHSKAGDLHTPNLGFHLGTPLSMSASNGQPQSATALEMHGFQTHLLESQSFQDTVQFQHQQSYAPSTFVHQHAGFNTGDVSSHGSPVHDKDTERCLQYDRNSIMTFPSMDFDSITSASLLPSDGKLRYDVTFNAPTAMIKNAEEIPITYLNKGQAYTINITDSLRSPPSPVLMRYRTVVRISFEDEQQRRNPAACWQLWKEGRGTAEAHHRGGKLQAVEYVDPNQGGDSETKRSRVELATASFDSFSVTWAPVPGASTAECSIAVRFNFLSTDFSHSKGVKGVPVRLCVKNEVIFSGTPDTPATTSSEVSFCKVKLFRDHGAERKLSNDVAHIKKMMDKISQQIVQVESGRKDAGKRKRSGSMAQCGSNRPSKVQKRKRTWSFSSQGSSGKPMIEDDLNAKLITMQDMFSSTRPVSVLHLKGDERDDPDLHAVTLPGLCTESIQPERLKRQASREEKTSKTTASAHTSLESPSPSLHSVPSHDQTPDIRAEPPPQQALEGYTMLKRFTKSQSQATERPVTSTIKVQRGQSSLSTSSWIDVSGIDSAYEAPTERRSKPVACFYVLNRTFEDAVDKDCYRAVYLMERNLKDLVTKIAIKCNVEPKRVIRTLQINPRGLRIVVDDDVVRGLPEGQDMIVEFCDVQSESWLKQEEDALPNFTPNPLEMRLKF
ncbi:MAG: hypothetical protein LQ351_004002 [Letrouitia transgressa]|nr:MAG: hypothetical protein LQ351_004002 [Letrouitia transgressa]